MHIHKVENINFRNFIYSMSLECQISINNNIHHSLVDIMPIFTTWPVNVLGGNPFVKGLAIIKLVLICSIQFHMFNTFGILVVFRKEDSCGVITINSQLLGNIVNNSKSWNKIPQPISLNFGLKACHKFSLHGGCNNDWMLRTFPWNRSSQ